MTLVGLLRKWVVATPLTGLSALGWGIAAVAVPTLYLLSFDTMVMDMGVMEMAFCVYLPFTLLSAVVLGWKRATAVALVSLFVVDALFIGPPYQLFEGTSDLLGDVGFLIASGAIIALVQAIRTALVDLVGPTAANGVIFSVKDGQAWASWPTAGYHLRLGPPDEIAETMKDFVAQVELGKRMTQAEEARAGVELGAKAAI